MTQKFRWLAASALLLAFGAGAVRAEEEQEEIAPPAQATAELLPAPHPVGIIAITHAASSCQGCTSCGSCACCSQCRSSTTPADPTQYIVTTKVVNASPDGDCEVITSPRVAVFGEQPANVLVQDVQTSKGQHGGVALMIQVTKQDKQVRLKLGLEESKVYDNAPSGAASRMTMRAETACDVTLGKMKRLVFTKNANGSDAEWVEVMVNEIAPVDDAEDSPLDCLNEAIGDLIDTVADVATSLFGDDEVEPVASPTPAAVAAAPLYLQAPPLYCAVPAGAPLPAVQQCVAVEAVKKSVKHVRIGAMHGTKSVEYSDGDKGWKGTADTITLRDGQLILEGRVHMVSSDGEDELTAEKLSMKATDLEIQIGD